MIRKALLVLVALLLLFVAYQVITFPRVGRLKTDNPDSTAFMERRQQELRSAGKSDELQHTWVPYESISSHLRSAVIVSEDSRFYDHDGVDTAELEKILREAWEKRELGRGGSTITQQLAKNLYLSPSRSPLRKLKEIVIARRMEQVLDKKRILELYLNVVEFGERVYGAEAAARHYFGTSAASLSPAQAALLAGSLPNPRKMNPGNPGPYLSSRRDIILSRMHRWGYTAERSVASGVEEEDEQEEDIPDEQPSEPEPLPGDEESEADGPGESPTGDPAQEDAPVPDGFTPIEPPPAEEPGEVEPDPGDPESGDPATENPPAAY